MQCYQAPLSISLRLLFEIIFKVNFCLVTGLIGTVVMWIDRACCKSSIQLQHTNDNFIYHSATDEVELALKNVRTKNAFLLLIIVLLFQFLNSE